MNLQKLFYNATGRIKAVLRIMIFTSLLSLSISPLILIDNSYFQFLGALLILIFGLYLNSKYLDKRNFLEYGLKFNSEALVHLVIGLSFGIVSVILMLLIGKTTDILSISESISMPQPQLAIPFAFKMFLVAILEETFFRGYLFTNFYEGFRSKKISNRQALLISLAVSSLLFGLAHFSNNHASILSIVLLTINGMVWYIQYRQSGIMPLWSQN